MLDLKSLIPWGGKSNVPTRHDETREPLAAFRREVDRLFDNFFRGLDGPGPHALASGGIGWPHGLPSIDVTESDKGLVISAELPGVDKKDFEVTLSGDVLTVTGEKKYEREEKDDERS